MYDIGQFAAALVVIFVIIGGVFYWLFLCFVVSNAGGWARLPEKYAAKGRPKEDVLKWQSLRIGKCAYRKSITVSAKTEGLYLAVGFFFRPAHAPVFIPWSAVIGADEIVLGVGPVLEISVEAFPVATAIQFPAPLAERLRLKEFLGTWFS